MELNYWTGTEFEGGTYDESRGAVVGRARAARTARGAQCIRATSSWRPASAAFRAFPTSRRCAISAARSCTPASTRTARRGGASDALVIGTGNSGHDIAQDLHASGARVTLVQRSSTLIVNVEPSAQLAYALYDEGPPLEDCDLITASIPLPLARKSHILADRAGEASSTSELLDGLERLGLQARFRRGRNRLAVQVPHARRRLLLQRRLLRSGRRRRDRAGAVRRHRRVRRGGGAAAQRAIRYPPTWSCWRPATRARSTWCASCSARTSPRASARSGGSATSRSCATCSRAPPQPGLWFIAGSLAQCRIYSKYLGAADQGVRGRAAAPARSSRALGASA